MLKMEKQIDYFMIDHVSYGNYGDEKMYAKEISRHLKNFRKLNRPSFMFVNALLDIQKLQQQIEQEESTIERLIKEQDNNKKEIVFWWVALIVGIFVFGVGFWTIVGFLIDLFV